MIYQDSEKSKLIMVHYLKFVLIEMLNGKNRKDLSKNENISEQRFARKSIFFFW